MHTLSLQAPVVVDRHEPTSVDEKVRIFEMLMMSSERRADPRTLV